jgi:type I restriction enzyme S subunit
MNKYDSYKDSGIEWIGEIPSHWEVRKFGNVSYMKGRIGWQGLKQSEFTNNPDQPFLITGMNFHDGEIRWNEVYHISEDRYNEAPEIQLTEDDVLFTKDGTIGKLLYVDSIPYPYKASLNSHLLVLRPLNNSYNPRFLYFQLQSMPFKHHVELTKTGTTFYGITQEGMGQYKMILPPPSEQTAIANYLDPKTT